jgi:GNAT superfamily N-acetyltransferase
MQQIRFANEEDHSTIVEFQLKMAKETEGLELDRETVSLGVMQVMRNPQKGKYIVATNNDEKIVASLMLTPEWSDWRNRFVLWFQSVYVVPDERGKGIFKKMYEHVKSKIVLEDEQNAGLRLYVDASNKNAIEVYKKLGMDGDHYRVFEWMRT